MKKSIRVLMFLLFAGQIQLSAQSGFIPINVDFVCFRANETESYLETSVSFYRNSLQFAPNPDSSFTGRFSAHIDIYEGQTLTHSQTRNFESISENPSAIPAGSELRHIFPAKLSAGDYRVEVVISDLNNGARGEFKQAVAVVPVPASELAISDLQLSAQITRSSDRQNIFYKNGLKVVPHPSGIFSITLPMMYYYAEAYQLEFDAADPGKIRIETFVQNDSGEVIRKFPVKEQKKAGKSAVIVGGNNIIALPAGRHSFHVRVTDLKQQKSIETSKLFQLFKPSREVLAGNSNKTAQERSEDLMLAFYLQQPEATLDIEFQQARYIASKSEEQIFETLDFQGKARFLTKFWQKRDTDISTPKNEYRQRYLELLKFAAANFKTRFREGWETDRGRILLTYGAPSDIEKSPFGRDTKPYVTWSYDGLEGGSIFIFADLRGFGEFELLHSTYSMELSQPDWERLVQRQDSQVDDSFFK